MWRAALGILMLVLLATSAWLWGSRTPVQARPVAYWQEKIQTLGAESAHAYMIESVADLPDNDQHLTAHKFGDALYETKGLEGVRVCTHKYGQGCFHQYFMTALHDQGEGVVIAFSDACARVHGQAASARACNHGLGHGVMVAFEQQGLSDALGMCGKIEDEQAFFGCIDGVFMEYFTPTHTGRAPEEIPVRAFDPARPYDTCKNLAQKFLPTCIYMQSSWWLFKGVTYTDTAELCRNLPEKYVAACFKSMGHVMGAASDYRAEKVIAKCAEISRSAEEEIMCRAGAHWAFSRTAELGVHLSAEEMALCNLADPEAARRCTEESDMISTAIGISVICCDRKLD